MVLRSHRGRFPLTQTELVTCEGGAIARMVSWACCFMK